MLFWRNTNGLFTWVESQGFPAKNTEGFCRQTQTVFTCRAGLNHYHVTGMPSDRPLTKDKLNPSWTSRSNPEHSTKPVAFYMQMHFCLSTLIHSYCPDLNEQADTRVWLEPRNYKQTPLLVFIVWRGFTNVLHFDWTGRTIEMCFWQSCFQIPARPARQHLAISIPSAKKQLVMSTKLLFTGKESAAERREKWLWTHYATQQTLMNTEPTRPMRTNDTLSGHLSMAVTCDRGIF